MCSDGLAGMSSGQLIGHMFGECSNPEWTCRAIIDAANATGGRDNVSAVVIKVKTATPNALGVNQGFLYKLSVIITAGSEPRSNRIVISGRTCYLTRSEADPGTKHTCHPAFPSVSYGRLGLQPCLHFV